MNALQKLVTTCVSFTLLFISPLAMAQQGMSDQQMKAMMEQAMKMQACLEDMDEDALAGMEAEAEAMEAEISALCAAGKRDEATAKAMAYGLKMQSSPEMQKMRECGEGAMSMMPGMAMAGAGAGAESESRHVCDDL